MQNAAIIFVFLCLMSYASAPAQEQTRALHGGGHALGETVEQFYSKESVGSVFSACQARDWKAVSRLSKSLDPSSKTSPRDICAAGALLKQHAASGARLELKGSGDKETQRADTFTFDGGHLVKIDMVYSASAIDFEGVHPKSFAGLLAGLQEAYGEPTKSYTETVLNAYGVKYEAHRAVWTGEKDVISIIEQPGESGWTEIIAQTIGEFDRAAKAPKAANPLQ
jgi:hypothetical protein